MVKMHNPDGKGQLHCRLFAKSAKSHNSQLTVTSIYRYINQQIAKMKQFGNVKVETSNLSRMPFDFEKKHVREDFLVLLQIYLYLYLLSMCPDILIFICIQYVLKYINIYSVCAILHTSLLPVFLHMDFMFKKLHLLNLLEIQISLAGLV